MWLIEGGLAAIDEGEGKTISMSRTTTQRGPGHVEDEEAGRIWCCAAMGTFDGTCTADDGDGCCGTGRTCWLVWRQQKKGWSRRICCVDVIFCLIDIMVDVGLWFCWFRGV